MSDSKLTPSEMAAKAFANSISNKEVFEYLATATPNDLQEFINYFPPHEYSHWFHKGRVILDVRLAEIAATSTNKIVQHTDILTQQTEKLLNESVALTKLTKQLKFWTIIIGIFAAVQIVIMIIDLFKH
jgi:hypothetical protein